MGEVNLNLNKNLPQQSINQVKKYHRGIEGILEAAQRVALENKVDVNIEITDENRKP